MLLVPTYLDKSPIHGIGLFASEPIKASTVVWRFDDRCDKIILAESIPDLPCWYRAHCERYGFQWNELFVVCGDNGHFMNHSESPALCDSQMYSLPMDVAARDIAAGEEITCDYRTFDDGWKGKLEDAYSF